MGKQRYTQTVARGLGFIRGYCAERDVRHQCENCRRHRDVSDAIAWLDGQIEAHKPAKEDS